MSEQDAAISATELKTDPDPLYPILWGYRFKDEIEALRKNGISMVPIGFPWELLRSHEAQAQTNHGQTLRQLAERGGLGPDEIMAIMENRCRKAMSRPAACRAVNKMIVDWEASK